MPQDKHDAHRHVPGTMKDLDEVAGSRIHGAMYEGTASDKAQFNTFLLIPILATRTDQHIPSYNG
jgi:hypothetical protein